MLRPFEEKDAPACFEIILDAAATMGGLNYKTIKPGRYRTGKAVFEYVVMRKPLSE